MHVKLPLLIVNHYAQTVNLCCIIIMASRGSGRSKGYSGAFLVPPMTGQKLPEMQAINLHFVKKQYNDNICLYGVVFGMSASAGSIPRFWYRFDTEYGSKGYSGAFLVPPMTGQKLPEMQAINLHFVKKQYNDNICLYGVVFGMSASAGSIPRFWYRFDTEYDT